MSSNKEFAEFTSRDSNPVVCQRCLQSFENGTELFFMHDRKPDASGKRVCAGCRQHYLKKTETRQREIETTSRMCQSYSKLTALQYSNKSYLGRHGGSTPGAQITQSQEVVSVQRAVAEAQRKGIIRI
jgi:hypothetical protein